MDMGRGRMGKKSAGELKSEIYVYYEYIFAKAELNCIV